ncbi:hypothetical protein LCGC14_2212730 [marine sediment metagenome]|uniref:Uncharacterized protein n=1 Tax=marine sediment metagenome TaxID=412755 RepID=A0A0F9G8V5_9ZZZZ
MNNVKHLDAPASTYRTPRRVTAVGPRTIRPRLLSEDELAQWVRVARHLSPVREDLVERIKAEIDRGSYETPDQIEAAIDGLLKDLDRGL